jgi:hypothetical protein
MLATKIATPLPPGLAGDELVGRNEPPTTTILSTRAGD